MAPKRNQRGVTSSRNRSTRSSSKPISGAKPSNRSNRQQTSTARVTQGSGGRGTGNRGTGGRVTNASQRPVTPGSARVTGTPRPALPPGTRGGALATRPSSRPALPPSRPGGALAIRPRGGTPPRGPGVGAGLLTAAATPVVRAIGERAGTAFGNFLVRQYQKPKSDKRQNLPGGQSNKPKKPNVPASAYERLYHTGAGRSRYGLDKPQARPTTSRRSSSTSTGSGSTAPRRSSGPSRPSAPSRSSSSTRPSTPKPPMVSQTKGIGPVKSGEEYARKKGSLAETARELREMRKRSEERQKKK